MRKYAPIVALLSLLLAACYSSSTMLLDPSAARQPWPTSTWSENQFGTTKNFRATKRSDGWYDYAEQNSDGTWGDNSRVLLNDLGSVKGHTLYVYGTFIKPEEGEGVFIYGVVVALPNGKWKAVTPDCENAVAAGIAKSRSTGKCLFANRAQLLDALREYANTPQFWKEVEGK
jgi:hypothetical protein